MKAAISLALALSFALPNLSRADETFRKRHPRRAEVNKRERNQKGRIEEGLRTGKLTPEQAKELRQDEKGIKKEEVQEVKANGGHLTKEQQRDLNQKLNAESKKIYDEKHPAATPPASN